MFGFFKSKEDKEAENIVNEIVKTRGTLEYDGNVVYDLGLKIKNRYKLTLSVIEEINISGILPTDIKDSGCIVIAIDKRKFMVIEYLKEQRITSVYMGSSTENFLNDLPNGINETYKGAIKGEGVFFRDFPFLNLIGAITTLGYEVGSPVDVNDIYFPFEHKGHTLYLVKQPEASWIVFEE